MVDLKLSRRFALRAGRKSSLTAEATSNPKGENMTNVNAEAASVLWFVDVGDWSPSIAEWSFLLAMLPEDERQKVASIYLLPCFGNT